MAARLKYGQATDVGMERSANQDALLTLSGIIESTDSPPPFGMFIVADGMGGHTDGERASYVAATTLARHVANLVYLPMLMEQELNSNQPTIPEVLEEAMHEADKQVKSRVPEGGTTLTAAIIYRNLLYIAHVGDSRAYLINDGNMELITRDHSLARRLQEIGHLTPEEAEAYPQKNVLYRAIGQGDLLEDVDRATRRLLPGSQLLLCSDGLWGVVNDQTILRIIEETTDAQEACDRLIAAANQAGGPDNITAVLVQIPL
jgi:serine/threonine protein phosphatase PrpC